MTSNVGSREILGESDSERRETKVHEILREYFKPEFLNRIDEIVIFESLGREQIRDIVRIQLKKLEGLLAERQLHLSIGEDALKWLGDRGYDPDFGARPLKRLIQRELQNVIATEILKGSYKPGDTIKISTAGGKLAVEGATGKLQAV